VSVERGRVETFGKLEDGLRAAGPWYMWGPYLSERQWGTVREDYSPGGTAWEYLPHDHARSRAYRWGEDGLAGFCDVEQRLCLSLALWNGRDPILKERIFGLTGNEGNHGEDAKEYWWYLDAVPSHAWNRWRYHYPQRAFPYNELVAENGRRGKQDPEFELLDTGVFDDNRYWIVEVDYAKADPHDLLMTVRVTNAGPETDTVHVLPTAWYRNTWAWDEDMPKPELRRQGDARIVTDHPFLGSLELVAEEQPALLFCDNDTNTQRLFGSPSASRWPKDGINDHVVTGAETVSGDAGTKAAFWYVLELGPGETAVLHIRLRPADREHEDPWTDFDETSAARRDEADEFFAELTPPECGEDEALVLRQALAGMLWSKQLFNYGVGRWLDGDPTQPRPPESRLHGRNAGWRTFDAFDIMSMPDKWEYPWFAAWDLAFHCVALAHVDPAFAKYQLVLLCREWFQHPNGALPAYEWSFDDVNPPVQAWAALEVFMIDGARDFDFLSRVFDKLLVNFTWWVNRLDRDGSNVFEGGFLGLDNIGPLDRSHLAPGQTLEQSDSTGWMAAYALVMASAAAALNRSEIRPATDLVLKFLEHFALISGALRTAGLWDDDDGFFYDRLRLPDGSRVPLKVRSIVGILPLLAAVVVDERVVASARGVDKRSARMLDLEQRAAEGIVRGEQGDRRLLLGAVPVDHVLRVLARLFDESEFLSPYGLRAVSRWHAEHPFELDAGGVGAQVDYEPAESTTGMFGGNSNWRGPIWFPVNYLVVSALRRYARFFGDDLTIEYPTGSGGHSSLAEVADDLRGRLVSLFLVGEDGRRPCFGWVDRLQHDPEWRDNILFSEYFHGDNGAGLGAAHQTGWTGLVADLIIRRREQTLVELLEARREEVHA
jgi:Mannosylglycerate hydrolase MGH1-like glycoside hydrolase domain